MNLYILRHGPAEENLTIESKYPDDRPLTEEGIEKMTEAAKGMKAIGLSFDSIIASPMSRTHQTAKIVAEYCADSTEVRTSESLRPGATIQNVRLLIDPLAKHQLIVGHAPDVGQITAELIGAKAGYIEFKKGSLACIEFSRDSAWLQFLLTPRVLRGLA